jgi:glycosyltransferase involved in cell wall biosynthesis
VKILSISSSYPLTPGSNSGIFVKRLLEELAKENQVTVITPAHRNVVGALATEPAVLAARYGPERYQVLCHEPGGIPAALKKNRRLLLAVPFLLLALFLKTLAQARRYDIIQANWATCGAVAGLAGFLTRTPLVTTLRGDDVNSAQRSAASKLFLSMAIMFSKTIVTVSDDIREQLLETFAVPGDKVITIPNGVNSAFISRGQEYVPGSSPGKLSLVTVGSLIPRKNVAFLVRALARLPGHVDLTVAGEGEEKDALVNLSRTLGLQERVHFLGAVDPDEVPGLLSRHDIFVLCSFSEGRSNAIYEAMASGRAVIASDIPGTREQIAHGDTGYLFGLESEDTFVELVNRLDRERALAGTLGDNARRWIVDNGYTWQAAREKYTSLFQRLMSVS